jgi:peptidoglycan/xylan/chitin deacetylase (PgdA/CDA1 family)
VTTICMAVPDGTRQNGTARLDKGAMDIRHTPSAPGVGYSTRKQPTRTATRLVANLLRTPCRIVSRRLARLARSRTVILCYHSIGDAEDAVSANDFLEQMRYLKDCARVVSLDQILSGRLFDDSLTLNCAITFDDGYAGVFEIAHPILCEFGLPSLVYVTTDAVGDESPKRSDDYSGLFPGDRTLTWRQVMEMNRLGVTIGSHLCLHKDMTTLAQDEGLLELRRSKEIIEQRLRVPCRHFAYPFGYFNNRNVQWVRKCGYQSATTVVFKPVRRGFDPLRIPRMCVGPAYDMKDFTAILRGDYDYLPVVQRMRHMLRLPYSPRRTTASVGFAEKTDFFSNLGDE